MTATQDYIGTLVVLTCGACGVTFGMDAAMHRARKADHKSWWCPNGCCRAYKGESDAEAARRQAKEAEQRADRLLTRLTATRDQLQASERSARAYRGHLTRMRKKVAAGVCPVPGCRRHFANVKSHVETKHGAWLAEHQDVLADA